MVLYPYGSILAERGSTMYPNLKKYRIKAGFETQAQFAEILNMSPSYYNQLENGTRRMSLPVAKRIAAIIGTKLCWPETMSWLDELFYASDVAKRNKNQVRA